MKRTLTRTVLVLALTSFTAVSAEETDCYELSVAVTKSVTTSPDSVLLTVQREVSSNPGCSCEVVKAAIVASEADRKLVGQIVATAIESAPDKMRIIAQCAIAVAPDALPEVQAVIAQLDPQGGEGYSGKGGYAKGAKSGGKGGKVDIAPDGPVVEVKPASPLDGPYLVPGIPFIHPPFRTPPSISDIGDIISSSSSDGGSSPSPVDPEFDPEFLID